MAALGHEHHQLADNSQDSTECQEEDINLTHDHQIDNQHHTSPGQSQSSSTQTISLTTTAATTSTGSSGFYDAEKCRAHIANQIKVSKIDRFAAQVDKAIEIELEAQSRLMAILNMFMKRTTQVAHDFTFKCKLGLQRHRQDRILNQQRTKQWARGNIKLATIPKRYSISNDLLYGQGVQLVQSLFHSATSKQQQQQQQPHIKTKSISSKKTTTTTDALTSDDDYLLTDSFEPSLFVKQLENFIRDNLSNSKAITVQLNTIRQLFERLASDHRDKVDLVYAAEEERQATTVIRRSAYNLSVAANKATSTPVHVHHLNHIA